MVARVVSLVARWYFIRMQSRKRKITYSMSPERERIRDEITKPTTSRCSVQNATSFEDDDLDMMSPSDSNHVSPSDGAARGNKKAKISVDKEKDAAEGIKEAIEKMADAIRTSGELLGKKAPIDATQTFQLLVDLGFEPPLIHVIYSKLTMNVNLLNLVLGCPMERRKEFLLSGVLGDLNSFGM
ncbi:hypothetical protein CCACVL1_05264 [Corchorus capsularis]|uniref:Uncharacterized protein n=1 Tax=Corchorus capsularis TaxID=210143 RepID=A0A1R3JLY2_COCAP|nr:hypothetical protein CCACVL1_05264 [Corchorus capsularis]